MFTPDKEYSVFYFKYNLKVKLISSIYLIMNLKLYFYIFINFYDKTNEQMPVIFAHLMVNNLQLFGTSNNVVVN